MKPQSTIRNYIKSAGGTHPAGERCPEDEHIAAFYLGTLAEPDADVLRSHLAECPRCLNVARDARKFFSAMSEPSGAATLASSRQGDEVAAANAWARWSLWKQFSGYFSVRPALAFSIAAAALMVVVGGALLLFQVVSLRNQVELVKREEQQKRERVQELERQLAEERSQAAKSIAETQQEADRNRSDRENPTNSANRTPPERVQPNVATFLLAPTLVRDPGQSRPFELPSTATKVRLQVSVDREDYKSYQAVLRTADGDVKWRRSGLRVHSTVSGKVIELLVPVGLLDKRDYVVKLIGATGGGGQEELDQYPFSVVRVK